MDLEFRWDIGKLDKFAKSGDGGLSIPAYLSRSGVFNYKNPDGSTRKELRNPDEIFDEKSLSTLKGITVTEGHRAIVDSNVWKHVAVGHVGEDVRREGDKIAATIHVKDKATIDKIERGDLKEISLGYNVDLLDKPGVYEGEEYTHQQVNPRYNHAALGAKGWGRAGPEVALRLDGYTYPEDAHKLDNMSDNDNKALLAEAEKLRGENAALAARAKDLEAAADPKRVDAAVQASLSLRADAAKVLGYEGVKGTDREIMVATIAARAKEFKSDGLSDEALHAAFSFALSLPAPGLAKVQTVAAEPRADEKDETNDAYKRMVDRNKNLWKVK